MPRKSRPAPASGPRWRTAPGLGAGSTAVRERPADPEPEPPVVPRLRDAADLPAPEAGPSRAAAPPAEPPPDPAPPPEPAPAAQPAPGADPGPEPELARPERRLDAELPRNLPEEPAPDGRRGTSNLPDRPSSYRRTFTRSLRSLEPISDLEAAAFAGRFATDFQSFDEDAPTRRSTVLRPLLADPQASTWGWSGRGRQRAESPLPGRLFRSSDTVVFVEVLVRATSYARTRAAPVREQAPAGEHEEPVGIVGPASVPPEAGPGWVAVEANWLRMTVPITRSPDDGRLVVDPHLVPEQTT